MEDILRKLVDGQLTIDEAEKKLRLFSVDKIAGMALIDSGREFRRGLPEIILGEGKTMNQLERIITKAMRTSKRIVVSRLSKEQFGYLRSISSRYSVKLDEESRIAVVRNKSYRLNKTGGVVGIITAGTSDIAVAEESKVVAQEMGCRVVTAYDAGVAGLHRVFPIMKRMIKEEVDVLIVAAGREGALPSVVAGVIDTPIIALPTSVGYGLGEKGLSALAAMLQACSLGISVVNIDGGVAAGATAALIANRIAKSRIRNQTDS